MRPSFAEEETCAGSEVGNGLGHEYLSWRRDVAHSRGYVDSNAPDVPVGAQLDLADVQSAADLDAQHVYAEDELGGRTQRAPGSVERRQMTVSRMLHDTPTLARDDLGDERVKVREYLHPAIVPYGGGKLGGLHYVGEQDRYHFGFDPKRGSTADDELGPCV